MYKGGVYLSCNYDGKIVTTGWIVDDDCWIGDNDDNKNGNDDNFT